MFKMAVSIKTKLVSIGSKKENGGKTINFVLSAYNTALILILAITCNRIDIFTSFIHSSEQLTYKTIKTIPNLTNSVGNSVLWGGLH